MAGLIALDVASTTGVCWGIPGEAPRFQHIKWTRSGESADLLDAWTAGDRAMTWWLDFLKINQPDRVIIEAPVSSFALGSNTSEWATMLKYTLCGVFGITAKKWGVRVDLGQIGKVRKHFIGEGRTNAEVVNGKKISGAEMAKRKCMDVCLALGWTPQTLDEADAGALWHWLAHSIDPASVPRVDPLSMMNVGRLAAGIKPLRAVQEVRRASGSVDPSKREGFKF